MHPDGAAAVVPWLRDLATDVLVVTDPGTLLAAIDSATIDSVLSRTDWWTCNAREATAMTGLDQPSRSAAALACRTGRAGVLVRDGAAGCWLAVGAAEPVLVPGFSVQALDTTGAGDAHTGAFMAALAEFGDPMQAASRANAAAALAVTLRGPATGPTRSELEVFLATRQR